MQKIAQTSKSSQPKITVEMTAKNQTINSGLLPVVRFIPPSNRGSGTLADDRPVVSR